MRRIRDPIQDAKKAVERSKRLRELAKDTVEVGREIKKEIKSKLSRITEQLPRGTEQ
jgi:hypothetical protein